MKAAAATCTLHPPATPVWRIVRHIQHFAALRWGARHLDIAELHAVLRQHWDVGPEGLPELIEELVRDLLYPEPTRA